MKATTKTLIAALLAIACAFGAAAPASASTPARSAPAAATSHSCPSTGAVATRTRTTVVSVDQANEALRAAGLKPLRTGRATSIVITRTGRVYGIAKPSVMAAGFSTHQLSVIPHIHIHIPSPSKLKRKIVDAVKKLVAKYPTVAKLAKVLGPAGCAVAVFTAYNAIKHGHFGLGNAFSLATSCGKLIFAAL